MTCIHIFICIDIYLCTYVHIDETVNKKKNKRRTIFQFFLPDLTVTEPDEAEHSVRRQGGIIKASSCPWSFIIVGNIKEAAPSKLPYGAWDFFLGGKLGP